MNRATSEPQLVLSEQLGKEGGMFGWVPSVPVMKMYLGGWVRMTMEQWEGTSKSGMRLESPEKPLGWLVADQAGLEALLPQDDCLRTATLIYGDSWLENRHVGL